MSCAINTLSITVHATSINHMLESNTMLESKIRSSQNLTVFFFFVNGSTTDTDIALVW